MKATFGDLIAGADPSPQRYFFMVSIERIKELFEDKTMSDQEAKEIRDSLTAFVRKVFDKWVHVEINN